MATRDQGGQMTTEVHTGRYKSITITLNMLRIFMARDSKNKKQFAYSITYLAEQLTVHPRTVYRILEVLRTMGIEPRTSVKNGRAFHWLPADRLLHFLELSD